MHFWYSGAPRIVRADCGTENVIVAGLQGFSVLRLLTTFQAIKVSFTESRQQISWETLLSSLDFTNKLLMSR